MSDEPARKIDPKDVAATSATASAQRAGSGIFRRRQAAAATSAPKRKGPGLFVTALLLAGALIAMLAIMIATR